MGRADVPTLIPLDRVAFHLGIDPYHFNQIITDQHPIDPAGVCEDVWLQHDWQLDGKISRESLADALRQAEDMVSAYLGYSPLPRWYEEDQNLEPHYKPEVTYLYNSRGEPKSITTQWGYFIEGGIKATTLVDTPDIAYVDDDGDGYNETAEITFSTTVTDEDELYVFYPGKAGAEAWEIRPLTSVVIDTTTATATIKFPRYLVPLEILVERPYGDGSTSLAIDGDDVDNFLTEVDVYRIYSDPSQQVTFHYEGTTSDCLSTPCNDTTETGCLYPKNKRLGIVQYRRADWNSDTETYESKSFSAAPKYLTVNYRAGLRYNNSFRQMDRTLERMIIYFALSLVDRDICGCAYTQEIWQKQTEDLALSDNKRSFSVPWAELGNPFGTTRAAIALWKHITPLRLAKSPYNR